MPAAENLEPVRLTRPERIALVDIARQAILNHLTHSSASAVEQNVLTESLRQPSGAFISLHIGDELRGCIGSIYAEKSLAETVSHTAIQAATQDPRFSPLVTSDLAKVDIEVSVLSELARIHADDVRAGEHGLLLSKGSRRGLLLPQVAEQYGWTREEFLSQLCMKAGLARDAWQASDCTLQAFKADVFSESSLFDHEDYD